MDSAVEGGVEAHAVCFKTRITRCSGGCDEEKEEVPRVAGVAGAWAPDTVTSSPSVQVVHFPPLSPISLFLDFPP